VDLHSQAIQLVLNRGAAKRTHRVGHARARGGEHRHHRTHHLEADREQAGLALGDRDLRGAGEIPGEHQRPAGDGRADARGTSDRVGHQPGQGALAQFARQQRRQKRPLGWSRPCHEIGKERAAVARRARTGRGGDRGDGVVDFDHRHRGLVSRRDPEITHHRPADPDASLARLAREQSDADRRLGGRQVRQQRGQDRGFLRSLAGGSDRLGRLDNGGKQNAHAHGD
jgi:hypothetical protein